MTAPAVDPFSWTLRELSGQHVEPPELLDLPRRIVRANRDEWPTAEEECAKARELIAEADPDELVTPTEAAIALQRTPRKVERIASALGIQQTTNRTGAARWRAGDVRRLLATLSDQAS